MTQNQARMRIGELSRAFNLSNEALRFYESKGLLAPTRDPANGYRYYGHKAIQRIGNIKRMQNQAFTLDEVTRVLKPSSEADVRQLFIDKRAQLLEKERYRKRMLEYTEWVTECFDAADGAPALSDVEPAYYQAFDDVDDFWRVALRNSKYAHLLCHMPLSSFSTFVPESAFTGGAQSFFRGVLITEGDAELIGALPLTGFTRLPGGRALTCVVRMEEDRYGLNRLIEPFAQALASERLAPAAPLCTRQLASYIGPSGTAIHLFMAYLPVT